MQIIHGSDDRISLSSGKIINGLYEGVNAKYQFDRNSTDKVYEQGNEYTYFGDYKDDMISAMLGKYPHRGDHTVVFVGVYDVEIGKWLSRTPSIFIEGADNMTDEQIFEKMKKGLATYFTNGSYEKAVHFEFENYWDKREFLQYWTEEQREEHRQERGVVSDTRGDNFFLSMECPCKLMYDGVEYQNAMEAFEAQKSRPDFLKNRSAYLQDILYQKFNQNKDLRDKLTAFEGNIEYECDDDWLGTKDSIGFNKVGQALMEARSLMIKLYGKASPCEQMSVFSLPERLPNKLPSESPVISSASSMQTFSKSDVMQTIEKPKSRLVLNKGTVQSNAWKKKSSVINKNTKTKW